MSSYAIHRNPEKLGNMLPIGSRRVLIDIAVSGYRKSSLQINIMVHLKDIRDNKGDCTVFSPLGFPMKPQFHHASCFI